MVSLSISASTNRITTSGFAYAAAGNLVQWPGGTVTLGADYDVDGRLSVVRWDGVERERYYYDSRNLRVAGGGSYQVYGLSGELLGEYRPIPNSTVPEMWLERVYFAGRLAGTINNYGWEASNTDRLGSVRAARRYPFGEGNNADNDEFATYRKDTSTQQYYAWHRFYSATWGRFLSPDPYVMSGGLTHPQGWNRYSYVANDPVNYHDPRGLHAQSPYPPGYCPAEYSYQECVAYGSIREHLEGGLGFAGVEGGGGWDPCFLEPALLPSSSCALPILPIVPPRKERPKQPECFAQLKDRPVDDPIAAKFDAVHTFWWVQDSTGTQYIISGGPTKPDSSGTQYLNVSVTPGNDNGSGDSSRSHTHWSSGLSWTNCYQVDAMVAAAKRWQSRYNNTVVYQPVGVFGIGGPNSNSAAHYFGVVSGFNPNPPSTAYGWWSPVVFP